MKILILFAHPAFERSVINKKLLSEIETLDGVTIQDLYQHYPQFEIDIEYEQELLLNHDVVVLMHPLFWYGTPALLKQWQDLVLQHGWAYGQEGTKLKGKFFFSIVTTGGPHQAYSKKGIHKHTVQEFLLPIRRTAEFCKMQLLPCFGIHGTWSVDDKEMDAHVKNLKELLSGIADETISLEKLKKMENMNSYYHTGDEA